MSRTTLYDIFPELLNMRRKEQRKEEELFLTIENDWSVKYFNLKKGEIFLRFKVKYKKVNSELIDFNISDTRYDYESKNPPPPVTDEFIIKFDGKDLELIELKLILLKSCITFLKSGAETLDIT